ncbi:MAG: hypothetical protein ABH850_02510, partial [Candidatus Micrarchaeota archaeon]
MKTGFISSFFHNSLFFVFFLFCLFLLFSGCVSQEEQFKNKTLCLELTSYSFQKIPVCSSQEECFNKVEKELFNFPADSFSGSSALALNSYKNNLASSWLYFNKALEKTKEINQLCTQNNFSVLSEKTNELGFYLQKAFEFTDKTSIDSFSFILLEKNFLEKQKIELIPEEQLFDDFILFNQNLNELSTPDVYKKSDSYVSHYFSVSREFNEFSSKIGFYSLYLNEFSSTDLIGYYSKDGLNLIKSKEFYVPLLKKTFTSIFSFISSSNDLEESIEILKKMPSNELFELFGKFTSTHDSVSSDFSELVANTSLHKQQLKQRNNELSSNIESKIAEIDVKLSSLSFSSLNKFDSNILGFLFENLETNSVSQKENSVYSVDSFVATSKEKLFFLKAEFNELKKKEYFNEISLAETASSLKTINSDLLSLNQDADFYSNDLFNELIVLCNTKTGLIEGELNKIDFSGKSWEVISIGSKIAVKISDYKSLEKEEKLFYCKEIISLNQEFSFALNENEKFFLQSEKSFNECFDSLESIFYSRSLSDFADSFSSLKSMKTTMPVSYLSDSCSELKERVLNYLYSNDKEIKEINYLFSDSRELLSKLLFLNKLYPNFFSSAKTQSFAQKTNELAQKFFAEQLLPEFFPESEKTLFLLKELNKEMHVFFVSSFQEFLSSNFEAKTVPLEQALLGKTFLARQKVFFPNPLNEKLFSEFSFISPKISGEISGNPCIKEISEENKYSRILLSCLPENGLFIESDLNQSISFTVSLKVIEATQNKILFKKSIKPANNSTISRIKAEIPLEFNSDYAFVLFNSEKIPVNLLDSKNAVFFLDDLKPGSEIELFYSVPEPIAISFLDETKTQLDQNTFLITLLVEIKNNLAFNFDKIKISFPLADFDEVKEIEFFDSSSIISFDKIDGKIVFSVFLNEFQSKQFSLKFKLTDFSEYSAELKRSITSDLLFLSNSLDKDISAEAEQLMEKTDSVSEL